MEKGKASKFRFLGYKILKSSFEINDKEELDQSMHTSFEVTNMINEASNKFKLNLKTKITNKDKSIKINVEILGFFEFENNMPEEIKNMLFNSNAPAILFPYVRAYVSTLTALSGINPIILPTLNLSKK